MGLSNILVITPTTGSVELTDAINSVKQQTVNVDHLIVCDGEKFREQTEQVCKDTGVLTCYLPFNTGGGGFYGHRVMAGFSHLINHEYVLFLDQDNWYDNNHVESLVNNIETNKLDWSYSLRKIFDKDKNYLCEDNCESLGRWPVWVNEQNYLIDSSSYCFKTEFFRKVGHIWDHGWGADRRFYMILKEHIKHDNYKTTGLHTMCYRLGGNEGSVQKEFFEQGNKLISEKYGLLRFPWLA